LSCRPSIFRPPPPRSALLAACALAAVLLTGCGDSTIKAVQNTTLPDDDKVTIAKVLENRKACNKTEWETKEDNRGQKIVTYKCYFSTKDLNREQKSKRERFIASAKNTRETEQKRLKALDPEIKAAEKKLQPLPKDKEPDLAALEKTPEFVKMRRLIAKIDTYTKQPYDELRAQALLLSDEFSSDESYQVWGRPFAIRSHTSTFIESGIRNMLHHYKTRGEKIEQERISANPNKSYDYQWFSESLNWFHTSLPVGKNSLLAELDKRINAEKAKTQKENESAKRQVENANRPIQREIERLTQKLASYGKDFEKQLKQRAEQEYPDYDAVFEAFGWEVDRQGRPSLEIGGLMYQSKQDDDDFRRYVNPAGILNRIAKFDAKDFASYRQELGRVFVR